MPVSPSRAAAFDILLTVEHESAYASELLHSAPHATLSPADHALATELVMGVLRWQSWLDRQIAAQSSHRVEKLDLEVLGALRLAAFQLEFLDRVPSRAAVHESVELVKRARKRSAVPFANAVLRKLAAALGQHGSPSLIAQAGSALELAESSSHPLWILERWEREFGLYTVRHICLHDQTIPPTAVCLSSPAAEEELANEGVELAAGQLLTSARRIRIRRRSENACLSPRARRYPG